MSIVLSDIEEGESVQIMGFSNDFIGEKLIEMGCLIGDEITVLKRAPLGDPLFVQVGLSQLGLRISEASEIQRCTYFRKVNRT